MEEGGSNLEGGLPCRRHVGAHDQEMRLLIRQAGLKPGAPQLWTLEKIEKPTKQRQVPCIIVQDQFLQCSPTKLHVAGQN